MDRRDFIKSSASLIALGLWEKAFAAGQKDMKAGKTLERWRKGQFQVHFIYTGVAESMFIILPDGTTMLLDCGDHNAVGRGDLAVPVLPNSKLHSGEWIARYVQRVNPHGNEVDYMMLSHYHSDHGGSLDFYADRQTRGGRPYFLSGFSQAAEYLSFGKAFDRAWPDYNDPIPLVEGSADCVEQMKQFYGWMQEHRGLEIEKFKVGAADQIAMLHNPGKYTSFHTFNICGNGRIACPDGSIRDLYEGRKEGVKTLNENGMSLGMIFSYGPFRFFAAGDFSDKWKMGDGSTHWTENDLGEVLPECQVAKINHHGYKSMPEGIVKALRSRVYVSCVWDVLHNMSETMERLCDRNIYSGERIVCPGIMPSQRRTKDEGAFWLNDVAESSFEGGHIVLTVENGGKDYSITYVSADDESMTIRSVMRFKV